ncbi:MAG: ferrochelatase [Oleiphilaceae bacterium]|jgi:ferrochelatase
MISLKTKKYIGTRNFSHQKKEKVGVLITNLGTPEAPTTKAVRTYLTEFLHDPRIIEIPRLLWLLILHGFILRVRPKRSAKAYQSVWGNKGSPLMFHTQDQCTALSETLKEQWGDQIQVEFAMRYGSPNMSSALQKLADDNVTKLVVLPLYPQYASSTIGSTFDAMAEDLTQRRWLPQLRFISGYLHSPLYIEALAESVKGFWAEHGKAEKLILSYHGLPEQTLKDGDPYFCQCHATTRLLVSVLGLTEGEYLTTFQSRVGRAEWLKPYTDDTMKSLPAQGVKSIQVICPGFSSDCLETIEEIEVENRDYFIENGGENYAYIPALNASENHIKALASLVNDNLAGWNLPLDADYAERQAAYLVKKEQYYPDL